ncbi:MAG TPA: hydrogenase formation protein HypD [Candidatus Hodarchaeales archaeon]|nr:hydrogenase formation protein HypD [Candidatus Hodarchaeales archaeon]
MSSELSELTNQLRSKKKISGLLDKIKIEYHKALENLDEIVLMHVCGTHEDTLMKNGLRFLLSREFPRLRLVAGPGCPVCVSPVQDINLSVLIALSNEKVGVISYGDMIRVPGSSGSLEVARQQGARVITVYSVTDAVKYALKHTNLEIVFISPGFETTAPATAVELRKKPPDNFSVLSSHRLVPPALEALLSIPELPINGFILPGHVSVIMGSGYYREFGRQHQIPCAVAGFEPYDMLAGVLSLLRQLSSGEVLVDNVYRRAVREEGNLVARQVLREVFIVTDGVWRGLGKFPNSALELSPEYSHWNARLKFKEVAESLPPVENETPPGCSCPKVVVGLKEPEECGLFMEICTPEHPIGPCMVGLEGTCRIRAIYS